MRTSIVAAVLCGLLACSTGSPSPAPAETVQAAEKPLAATRAAEPIPEPAAPDASTLASADARAEEPSKLPNWPGVTRDDEVPLCIFSSYEEREKASFIGQVRKQALKAGTNLVFGAFAPHCMSEACEARPTLQCWVDLVGNEITVHSRFYTEHKPGAECTTNCLPVVAGCMTQEELKPGTYTVRHGARTVQVKIPSVLREPCLSRK